MRHNYLHAHPGDLPKRRTRLEGAPMNAYVLIAGLSGVAVFCAMAIKSFGARR